MSWQLVPYQSDNQAQWDEWVDQSPVATILHSRKFLSYHGSRFVDQSLLIKKNDHLIAVLPAAVALDDDSVVVSHPGASYGGLVHDGDLMGAEHLAVLKQVAAYYKQSGFKQFIYKPLPTIYRRGLYEDDLYSLFRLHALAYRVDLSSTVDLSVPIKLSKRRKRSVNKALKSHLHIAQDWEHIDNYWIVLNENLQQSHSLSPVHNVDEICLLQSRFPEQIVLRCVISKGKVIAGVLLFLFGSVAHAQYIASNSHGRSVGALDFLFNHLFIELSEQGFRYFDFGNSNENQGRVLNEGLYQYKTGFGGSGSCQYFHCIELERLSND